MADSTHITNPPISRQVVEAQIDLLIDLLDTFEPDPDLEPSLGWTTSSGHYLETPEDFLGGTDDREDDDEREPPEDSEPSLGWTDNPNQASVSFCAGWHGDNEDGTGPVRKSRPKSKTGGDVYRGCAVLR